MNTGFDHKLDLQMKTRILENEEGTISITAKKRGKTFEFKQFTKEISIACLLMEHKTAFNFSDGICKKEDQIYCRAVLPKACLSVSTIETVVRDGYEGTGTSIEELSNHHKTDARKKRIQDKEELYHNLLEDNENIEVYISPADDTNDVRASLHYYPWAIYALQGKADFYHEATMHLTIPVEIYDDIKTKLLNGPPIYKFIIAAVPEIIKLSTDTPEDVARHNNLFCEEHHTSYSLLFNKEVGAQSFRIISIFYDCDPVEIKKPSTIASFGSWKGANLADTLNEKISAELHELKNITENEASKQTTLLREIKEALYRRRWWF